MSASVPDNRLITLRERFAKEFGGEPQIVVRAPGRVNLIGEHTDYNDGLVFPVALDRDIMIAARAIDGDFIEIFSEDYKQKDRFSIADIIKTEEKPWSNYVRGTAAVLLKHGYKFGGFEAVSSGNVPQGAGLSSSAAYEVAVCYLINALSNLSLSKKQIALFAQEAENSFVGVNCGIMDQFISAFGETDSGLLIDCRTLDFKPITLNLKSRELALVVVHSGVQRGLVDSEYNERRRQCAEGVQLLAKHLNREVKSLREIEEHELDECAMSLPEIIFRRCRHVISENARVSATVEAFETGDLARVGKLLEASHQSLRQDFEVSCAPVDILVELTANHPGVIGARMTGGGFGGCIVALMEKAAVPSYTTSVPSEYLKQTGLTATVYDCQAACGASTV
ncbi:MAG: galactokinase [Candidatus Melainabacteria bacterium]|nr:galactokinase [Candidatus Melainabacteria bacterium]